VHKDVGNLLHNGCIFIKNRNQAMEEYINGFLKNGADHTPAKYGI